VRAASAVSARGYTQHNAPHVAPPERATPGSAPSVRLLFPFCAPTVAADRVGGHPSVAGGSGAAGPIRRRSFTCSARWRPGAGFPVATDLVFASHPPPSMFAFPREPSAKSQLSAWPAPPRCGVVSVSRSRRAADDGIAAFRLPLALTPRPARRLGRNELPHRLRPPRRPMPPREE